jgi:hypothetical protein
MSIYLMQEGEISHFDFGKEELPCKCLTFHPKRRNPTFQFFTLGK